MKSGLLDFPWDISLCGDMEFELLIDFENLVRRFRLEPVPFISPAHWLALCRHFRPNYAPLLRFVGNLVREQPVDLRADILHQPEPSRLTDEWRCALAHSILDGNNWRLPQIIISAARINEWPTSQTVEVAIVGTHTNYNRVIVEIGLYDSHPHSLSDFDPWDQVRCHPQQSPDDDPCKLPKPPEITEDIEVDHLSKALNGLRGDRQSHWYYIPPKDWQPDADESSWRDKCRAFPPGSRPAYESGRKKLRRIGWVDVEDLLWVWDTIETHWDVQLANGKHAKVSHTGIVLFRPN